MTDQLTDVLNVHVAFELQPHSSKSAEPEVELRVESKVPAVSTLQAWIFLSGNDE
jgi:hypothetical protein